MLCKFIVLKVESISEALEGAIEKTSIAVGKSRGTKQRMKPKSESSAQPSGGR